MSSFSEMVARGDIAYALIPGASVFVRHISPLLPVRYYVREIGSYLLAMHMETKIEARHVATLLSGISEREVARCVASLAGYVTLPTNLAELGGDWRHAPSGDEHRARDSGAPRAGDSNDVHIDERHADAIGREGAL